MKTFSSNMANGASKNTSIHTDFKNVNLILVKSAPEKSFNQKTVFKLKNWLNPRKIGFLGKSFSGRTRTFLKSV
jgi:hypothetical protein